MDLQRYNQGLIQPDDTLLVKIPLGTYQHWFDVVDTLQVGGASVAKVQEVIFGLLQKWVERNHPGYGVVAFEDYNDKEATALSRKAGMCVTWGMYVLLQIGGTMQPISITDKLLNQ